MLAFAAAAVTPLVGTAWQATGINNGRGGVVSLVEGTAVTATFDADGRVAGSGGCNPYTGGYRVNGTRSRSGRSPRRSASASDPRA